MESISEKYVVMNCSGNFLSTLYRNGVGTVRSVNGGAMMLSNENEARVIATIATRMNDEGEFQPFKVETRMVSLDSAEQVAR